MIPQTREVDLGWHHMCGVDVCSPFCTSFPPAGTGSLMIEPRPLTAGCRSTTSRSLRSCCSDESWPAPVIQKQSSARQIAIIPLVKRVCCIFLLPSFLFHPTFKNDNSEPYPVLDALKSQVHMVGTNVYRCPVAQSMIKIFCFRVNQFP